MKFFQISFALFSRIGVDWCHPPTSHLLLTSLTLYHILSGLSRGLLKKIATFFQRAVSYTVWAWLRHTDFSVLYPNGAGSTRPVPYPLDTNSIPHLPLDCNRQNTQNWDFYFLDICATFLLTNCWRCVIMEISRRAVVGGALKMPLIVD